MNKAIRFSLIITVILLLLPVQTYAILTSENPEEILKFVNESFQAQVALSEKDRSLNEVHELLSPYFTQSYMELFLKENLVEENQKYFTLGSDFALYYIPFFSYNDDTKVVIKQDEIYVFEFFPGNQEGPVTYHDHYEGILLTKQNGQYKVAEYLNNIPDELIDPQEQKEGRSTKNDQSSLLSTFITSRIPVKKPLDFFVHFYTNGNFKLLIHKS
ncbi:DUF3993 domain-containing protein [Bacillus marasmi]|uniref:DUF3993 domain-containing protein n=1 Tax=Bacillus marasmi TaxID=1926279 RepID=UPI0011CBB13A|nr:DUF3993 domain-containing protein [Bacillus marasmi]